MGKLKDLVSSQLGALTISRRGFVKSTAVAGAAVALYGCSKDDGADIIYGGGGTPLR